MDSSLEETKDKLIKKKRNHILKRIKKHFGIVRRNSNPCLTQNNLPPLQFHLVHGDNIRISRDGTLARRFESFCRALTFSARPVRINERILVRFSEVSNNWNGGIRFGFTSNDPVTLENSLPKYACPDLTNRPGFWAKALHEQYCDLNNVLHYYINSTGDVIYGINGEEKGVILSGIDVRGLIWTLIDVYGNCTAIELLDARVFKQQTSSRKYAIQGNNQSDSLNCIVTPLHFLSFQDDDACLPPLQYNMHKTLLPLPFHRTKGRNIMLSTDCMVATRTKTDFCQGYVFTSLPIQIDEILVIQILKTDSNYKGALALGLTSCNPTSLQQYDFPDDCIFLLDRPEYWVLTKDISLTSNRGDEISVFITPNGEVSISKNGARSVLVMHIDHRLELWAFLDIYGSTQSVRMFRQSMGSRVHSMISVLSSSTNICHTKKKSSNFSTCRSQTISSSTLDSPIKDNTVKPSATNLDNLLDPISTERNVLSPSVGQTFVPSSNEMSREGGTVLVVNLPPTTSRSQESCYISDSSRKINQSCETFGNLPFSQDKIQFKNSSLKNNSLNQFQAENPKRTEKNKQKETLASECTICYEKTIDSVLYMCGHMCMCYECAIEQWQGAGDGQCPLCRAIIRDVIRTYIT